MIFQQPVWQDWAIKRPRTPYSVKVFILFDKCLFRGAWLGVKGEINFLRYCGRRSS